MANFNEAFNKVIFNEGGYVNDPDDAGGETYMGITRKNHPNNELWSIVDGIKQKYKSACVITRFLKKNDRATQIIKNIYKDCYWDIMNLDNFKSDKLAFQIFDSAVNIGVNATKKLLKGIL